MSVRVRASLDACAYACVRACELRCLPVCMRACVRACLDVCVSACVRASVYVSVCVCRGGRPSWTFPSVRFAEAPVSYSDIVSAPSIWLFGWAYRFFILIKPLRISWFLRPRFCGRARNLEITIIHLPFRSNPWYVLDEQASFCGRLYSVKQSLYRRSNAHFVRVCLDAKGS